MYRLIMDQLVNVLLGIDKANTVSHDPWCGGQVV